MWKLGRLFTQWGPVICFWFYMLFLQLAINKISWPFFQGHFFMKVFFASVTIIMYLNRLINLWFEQVLLNFKNWLVWLQQVTKRVDTNEEEWAGWNWRTDGDILVNGAFFVPSGAGLSMQYAKASSVEPKSAAIIDQLTMNAGVLGGQRYTYTHTYTHSSLS